MGNSKASSLEFPIVHTNSSKTNVAGIKSIFRNFWRNLANKRSSESTGGKTDVTKWCGFFFFSALVFLLEMKISHAVTPMICGF